MDQVELSTGDWSVRAHHARSFTDRLVGNLAVPGDSAVVLHTRTVHSFGQKTPIEIVGIDAHMRVVATRTLMPNRITVLSSARMILELPSGSPVPSVADFIEMTHG
jgi:uncharacterized membrane protein (UPF0127 family)